MTKKLVLLFSFLCISLLTYAGDTIPKNGWKEGKYYFKFIDKFSNQNCSAQADAEVVIDGNAIKSQKAFSGGRYDLIKFNKKKNFGSKRLDRKFAEIIVTLNIKGEFSPIQDQRLETTDIDSLLQTISQSQQYAVYSYELSSDERGFNGNTFRRPKYLSNENPIDVLKRDLVIQSFKFKELKPKEFHIIKRARFIVPMNDTIVISYKIKTPTLEEYLCPTSSLVEVEALNSNTTLSYINNLWHVLWNRYENKISNISSTIVETTGRRAYQNYINEIRTKNLPAIINEAGKTLPADCSAEIRHLLENRLKIAYYLRNPMNLGLAQKMGYLTDALQVFEDIEFNEDMLYDLPKAWEIIGLLSRYTGVFPDYAGDLPPYIIQMIEARGIPFDPIKIDGQGYLIDTSSVQQWCEDVKEILNKNSIKANDFLTQFMSMMAYYKSANKNWGLHRKQIENIKTGYTDEGWHAPLKSIQMYHMENLKTIQMRHMKQYEKLPLLIQ